MKIWAYGRMYSRQCNNYKAPAFPCGDLINFKGGNKV